ncbi:MULTISPECIES: AlpA family transcriptional regulator [Protofrankia]|uniref:Sigma-70 protein n=1 Tax=Protofrankia coriariae TaxID=1562887 RepID=A0ABR5F277_9ACTN|nr:MULTISPECIES: sigma-70 protein [Protofrankia]KLL10821.1 sigma-70 protein [Protofrankia coriariae]ONH34023.1 RNA polymerase subunit sigma-70 [Protofrankia sp. BMG5.30]
MDDVEREPWTTKDIATALGVSQERARVISHRDDFPTPIIKSSRFRAWSADDVEAWIAEHRPDRASE